MRAGRLISLVLILQRNGRVTAAALGEQLEVSERTVMRDIEALSEAGIPVYASRGIGGGFQLIDGYNSSLADATTWRLKRTRGPTRRATIRISPEGRRLAAVLARPQPLRIRPAGADDGQGWLTATFRLDSLESATIDIVSLGPHIEGLQPQELRHAVADWAERTANIYR